MHIALAAPYLGFSTLTIQAFLVLTLVLTPSSSPSFSSAFSSTSIFPSTVESRHSYQRDSHRLGRPVTAALVSQSIGASPNHHHRLSGSHSVRFGSSATQSHILGTVSTITLALRPILCCPRLRNRHALHFSEQTTNTCICPNSTLTTQQQRRHYHCQTPSDCLTIIISATIPKSDLSSSIYRPLCLEPGAQCIGTHLSFTMSMSPHHRAISPPTPAPSPQPDLHTSIRLANNAAAVASSSAPHPLAVDPKDPSQLLKHLSLVLPQYTQAARFKFVSELADLFNLRELAISLPSSRLGSRSTSSQLFLSKSVSTFLASSMIPRRLLEQVASAASGEVSSMTSTLGKPCASSTSIDDVAVATLPSTRSMIALFVPSPHLL